MRYQDLEKHVSRWLFCDTWNKYPVDSKATGYCMGRAYCAIFRAQPLRWTSFLKFVCDEKYSQFAEYDEIVRCNSVNSAILSRYVIVRSTIRIWFCRLRTIPNCQMTYVHHFGPKRNLIEISVTLRWHPGMSPEKTLPIGSRHSCASAHLPCKRRFEVYIRDCVLIFPAA